MKITIEFEDKEFYKSSAVFTEPDDNDINDMVRVCKKILHWMEYDHNIVEECFTREV